MNHYSKQYPQVRQRNPLDFRPKTHASCYCGNEVVIKNKDTNQ